ncbi:MAG TPA: hypothetical protein VG184_12475, partial [Acidimicrobiales bacterium]|nr:hypothetical protein [Acidimicrobiales bacterium]
GIVVCPRHHTMLHGGFTADGNANGVLSFRRPDSTVLGTTPQARRSPFSFAGQGHESPESSEPESGASVI